MVFDVSIPDLFPMLFDNQPSHGHPHILFCYIFHFVFSNWSHWLHLMTFDSRTCWVGDGSSSFLSSIIQVTGRAVGPWPPPQAPGWAPWPAETGVASTGVVVSEVFFLGGNRRETWRLGDPLENPWKNPRIMCLHWARNYFSRWGLQFTCLQWISQEGGSILYVVKWCMTPCPNQTVVPSSPLSANAAKLFDSSCLGLGFLFLTSHIYVYILIHIILYIYYI